MTEAFLQYVWQHQLAGRQLATTDGRQVSVLRAGDLNRDAGPDFFNARIVIGDIEWAGNVEVHVNASDWNLHRHSDDKAYNSIILHVVYCDDAEVTLQNGKHPATVELRHVLDTSLLERYDRLMNPVGGNIACADGLDAVPHFAMEGLLDRVLVERIESKSGAVMAMLEENHGGWEQTCYWMLARYFGGRVNALAFELLAKSVDWRFLTRWKDNPRRIEALLMGQAGMLDGYFEDEYPRMLQADYNAIGGGAGLRHMDAHLWRFYQLRPSSFPTLRISQFAHLVSTADNLFSRLLEMDDAKQMVQLFNQQADSYWDNHYHFDQPTEKAAPKRIGTGHAVSLVINAWVPLLFVYGATHGLQRCKDQALALLHQLPAENNNIMRLWKAAGTAPKDAGQSQALLQLYNGYCLQHRCLDCAVGYNIIKQR